MPEQSLDWCRREGVQGGIEEGADENMDRGDRPGDRGQDRNGPSGRRRRKEQQRSAVVSPSQAVEVQSIRPCFGSNQTGISIGHCLRSNQTGSASGSKVLINRTNTGVLSNKYRCICSIVSRPCCVSGGPAHSQTFLEIQETHVCKVDAYLCSEILRRWFGTALVCVDLCLPGVGCNRYLV
jgi:hypothetical protein